MRKIIIKKTSNPDYGYTSKMKLYDDTRQHQIDVCRVMLRISKIIKERGTYHDWSKTKYFNSFANDTLERLDTPDFKARDWYKIHTTKERHHLNASVPEKVDLIDCLEMIADCVCAGKARSGEVNPEFLILKDNILEDAYWNTIDKISEMVIVEEEDDE